MDESPREGHRAEGTVLVECVWNSTTASWSGDHRIVEVILSFLSTEPFCRSHGYHFIILIYWHILTLE